METEGLNIAGQNRSYENPRSLPADAADSSAETLRKTHQRFEKNYLQVHLEWPRQNFAKYSLPRVKRRRPEFPRIGGHYDKLGLKMG